MFPASENIIAAVVLGLFGLLFGSFGNVVIWRMPRGESIVSPPSHCPRCGHDVRWFDNLPVASWLALRGRCRDCAGPISVRYPIVEGASGALWALAGWRWGVTLSSLFAALLFWCLLVLAMIDIDTRRLPNRLVAVTAGLGVLGATASQLTGVAALPLVGTASGGWLAQPLLSAVAGAVAGGVVSGAIAWAYGVARGKVGLGMGDVKLLAAMGLFVGPFVLMVYALGNLFGIVGGLAHARSTGERLSEARIPFGPYLAAAAVATALWGPALWDGYLRLLGIG